MKRLDPEIAIPSGALRPVMSEALITAPVVVYSPTRPTAPSPAPASATNKFDPEMAIASGQCNPAISDPFTVAPEVVYSPIVPGSL